jgi:hypothetical protein
MEEVLDGQSLMVRGVRLSWHRVLAVRFPRGRVVIWLKTLVDVYRCIVFQAQARHALAPPA